MTQNYMRCTSRETWHSGDCFRTPNKAEKCSGFKWMFMPLNFRMLTAFVFLFVLQGMSAQTYTMSNVAVTSCTGTFYDNGGAGSNYTNSQTFTKTFSPGVTGQKVRMTFTSFATENGYDGLMIYDGPNTSSPLISSGLPAGSNATTCPAGSWRGNHRKV